MLTDFLFQLLLLLQRKQYCLTNRTLPFAPAEIYNRKKRIEYGMFVSKDESLMAPWSPPQVDHRPSVFSQFRPVDVTLYDLLYEPMFKGQISIELREVHSFTQY
jgi:hypothetical protein